jgi:ATP-dependent protease HslVU (ClpYQ) peptidase subunit
VTVVAYKDGTLAVDSLVCSGSTKLRPGWKKLVRIERLRAWAAGAGTLSKIHELYAWLEDPERLAPDDLDDSEVILLYDDGRVEVYDDATIPMPWPADVPLSAGSGEQAALAAMLAGADAVRAAEIACEVVNSCGLPVLSAQVAARKVSP